MSRLCLLERDQARVRRPQGARLRAEVGRFKVAEGAGIGDLVDGLLDEVLEVEAVGVARRNSTISPR